MRADPNRGWFVGCGSCPGSLHVINAAVVRVGPTCEKCVGLEAEEHIEPNELVRTELGWCGCGSPEEVDRMMLAYLTSRAHKDWPKPPTGLSEDAEMLLSYLADHLGWTEHGSSLYGAWLTDDGKNSLGNLRASSQISESTGTAHSHNSKDT